MLHLLVRTTASVGKVHSYFRAQSTETKLQIMLSEDKIVDEGIDDGAIEVQRSNVVVVGRGCVQENTKRRSKVRFKELYPLLNCSLQFHLSKL